MADVEFRQASRIYAGTTEPAVNKLDLTIADGEFLVLVGPSGSGKSTALRMLAGLEPVDQGSIHIGGRDVSAVSPKDRDIAMVFQNYALYPQMTVAENMGFALKQAKVPKDERRRQVEEAARVLDLTPYLDRKPKALSGGQRQRVAMGRAIVRQPQVYLMDEPLSNLDAKLRVQTRTEIADLQARLGVTTVYVTHDQVEAMTMGDRVAVLNFGVLQQCASSRELYERPATLFVAGFIGSPAMNLIEVPVDGGQAVLGSSRVDLSADVNADVDRLKISKIALGVRPEHFSVDPAGFDAKVIVVEELGADAFLHCDVDQAGTTERIVVRVDGAAPPARGESLKIAVSGPCHVFDPESGDRLGD